jgi:hypothetical protein
VAREISFKPGDIGLIVNGRVRLHWPNICFDPDLNSQIIGPIPGGSFYADDIAALIAYEKQRRVVPLLEALTGAGLTAETMDRYLFLSDTFYF